MRILQISSAQTLGGGERHLADLANGLAGRGHDVFVALRPQSPLVDELKLPRGNITTLPLRNSLDAKSARALARLVKKEQIQIVHAHMARDYPLAAYAVRGNSESRLIVTRHVLFPLSRLHRVTLGRAGRIIAVSEAVASQLRADAIAPAEKISVVLNGIDTAKFQQARSSFDRARFLDRWGVAENSLLVGTVGELTPLKGQFEFLQAARQILRQHPNAVFFVVGVDHSRANSNHARLQQLIAELELSERVRLLGWFEGLEELYNALDVFVSASHTESFGLAIAEAMATGTAVVATETEGARELIETDETGILVPIGDVDKLAEAVAALLGDENKRERLGMAAQRYAVANFSVERMVAETEEIFRVEI